MAAAGERVRAAAVPTRRALRRTTWRAWHAFTSARTANVLLGGIMLAGIASILVQQFGTLTLSDPMLYAAAVGYDNPFVFSRTFKKWIGWPPSDYRARQKS